MISVGEDENVTDREGPDEDQQITDVPLEETRDDGNRFEPHTPAGADPSTPAVPDPKDSENPPPRRL